MFVDKILDSDIQNVNFVVLDTETTGLSHFSEKIIEIAAYKVNNFKIIDEFHSFVNPGKIVPLFITELTGIKQNDVEFAPYFDEIAQKLAEFLEGSILVGHNVIFDYNFLSKEFRDAGFVHFDMLKICTVRMSRRLLPGLKKYNLREISRHLDIPLENAHRAYADAFASVEIFNHLLRRMMTEFGFMKVREFTDFQFVPVKNITKYALDSDLNRASLMLPDLPGVYHFIDEEGLIIYTGKAKSIKKRLKSHFSDYSAGKSKIIISHSTSLKYTVTNSELTALISEAQLIKQNRPTQNVQLKSFGNTYFIKIEMNHKFPKLSVSKQFFFDGNDYFGVFSNKKAAAEFEDLLNRAFKLRECKDKEFNRGKSCVLAEIDRCLNPCVEPNFELYSEEIQRLKNFLNGDTSGTLKFLIDKMNLLSEKLKFEEAAEIKKLVDRIISLIHRSSILQEPLNTATVLFEIKGPSYSKDFILLIEGKIFLRDGSEENFNNFNQAVEEYFEGSFRHSYPTDSDLETLRIMLSWIVENRESVKIYYLKKFDKPEDLIKIVGWQEALTQPEFEFDLSEVKKMFSVFEE